MKIISMDQYTFIYRYEILCLLNAVAFFVASVALFFALRKLYPNKGMLSTCCASVTPLLTWSLFPSYLVNFYSHGEITNFGDGFVCCFLCSALCFLVYKMAWSALFCSLMSVFSHEMGITVAACFLGFYICGFKRSLVDISALQISVIVLLTFLLFRVIGFFVGLNQFGFYANEFWFIFTTKYYHLGILKSVLAILDFWFLPVVVGVACINTDRLKNIFGRYCLCISLCFGSFLIVYDWQRMMLVLCPLVSELLINLSSKKMLLCVLLNVIVIFSFRYSVMW